MLFGTGCESPTRTIESSRFFEDVTYCVVKKDHPVIRSSLNLEQFLEAGHVVLRPTRTHIPAMERRLEDQNLERTVVVEVSHLLAMPFIVAQTNLIACMPQRLARYYARIMNLSIFPNPVFNESVPVFQIWHKNFDSDLGHRWLRTTLKQIANKL